MSRPPHMGRLSLALLTFLLTLAVFVSGEVSPDTADGLALLYLLPVALVAIEFGLAAGIATACTAMVLVGVWDATSHVSLSPVSHVARGALLLGAAWLCARMAERLRRTARVGDRYFELGEDMICTGNLAGDLIRVNRRWTEVLGWSEAELTGRSILGFVHPEDREQLAGEIARTMATGEAARGLANRLLTKGGESRHVEWSVSVDPDGDTVYAAARDVTERERMAQERRATQERLHAAFDDAVTGMAVVGLRGAEAGIMVQSNPALATILGVPTEDMVGTFTFSAYVHPDDIPALSKAMQPLTDGSVDKIDCELRIIRPSGEVRWLKTRASALHDDEGTPRYRLSQVVDITEVKTNEEQLRHLADHDPLSWLFNRRRFTADLEDELRANAVRGSRAAVLVMDLDGFKQVNDTAGHAAGDEVIKTVALGLIRRLRSGDVAGRLGGDEFGVLLRRVDPEQAVMVAHDLLRAVHLELGDLGHEVARAVTMSVGVTMVNGDPALSADEVLDRADRAMYRAKSEGGARVELAPLAVAATP